MPKVFPCFSPSDRELVSELASFLERGLGVEVLLEEGEIQPGADLISKVQEGLSADVVLVLLSPESVPDRWVLQRWQSVFWEQAAEVGTALATVLCRDCKFPDLLRRKRFHDARNNRLAAFRAIKRWLLSLWPPQQRAPFVPARLASFFGRDTELETLCTLLADSPNTVAVHNPEPGSGKTALALEFARRFQDDFDAVFWLTCGARTAAALAGDLAAQLGVRLERDLESNLNELRHLCARHRCLLVLDDAVPPTAALLAPRGRTSVLLTARSEDLTAALAAEPFPLSRYGPSVDWFRNLDAAEHHMLSAVSACSTAGFHLHVAAATAAVESREALRLFEKLQSAGAVAALDENGPRFLVPASVRVAAVSPDDAESWARRHAQAVIQLFEAPSQPAANLAALWPDLQSAISWALNASLGNDADWPLASKLARRAVSWARGQDRLAEAFEILQDWTRVAEQRADRRVLEDCAWEQVWILEHWGRSSQARALDEFRRRHYADQLTFEFLQS